MASITDTSTAKRKRKPGHLHAGKKQPKTAPSQSQPCLGLGPERMHAVVSPEEVELAVDTLQTLSQHPAIIKSKACKALRTAVYDFRQASTTGMLAAGAFHQLL